MVRDQIIEEVKEHNYFSVLVDETNDISQKEQLPFKYDFLSTRVLMMLKLQTD